jgi:multidrug efflux system membrane fusion protein
VLLLLVVCAFFLWRSFGRVPAQHGGGTSPAGSTRVVAAIARKGSIGVYVNGLGAVVPIYTVTVTSRVDGQLMQVNYREGQMVRQGDKLAQIDPRPFEVTLTQAQGALIRDEALLENARTDLSRYETLLAHNAIQEQQVATQRSLVKQYEGNVTSDQGNIQSSQLNLTYSNITSPIDGRVGLRLVDPGNLVGANSTAIAVITQLEPISVIFTIGEDQLPEVRTRIRAGKKLAVTAFDREMKNRISTGTLETIDNQIDPTTGTVKLRAIFANKQDELFPQQFVNAQMLLQEKNGVTLVPNAAIQHNGTNTYVWVVDQNQTAHVKNVTVGTQGPEESEISAGVTPGEVVITSGVDRLREGDKVSAEVTGGPAVKVG